MNVRKRIHKDKYYQFTPCDYKLKYVIDLIRHQLQHSNVKFFVNFVTNTN